MNQQVVDYLQVNKDNYSKESLIEQLKNAGHADNDIQEGLSFVYTDTIDEVPVPQAVNTAAETAQKEEKSIGKTVLIIGAIIFGVILFIVLILGAIVMVSLDSARDKAKNASAKSSISSTVPAALLCMDVGSNLTLPMSGTIICEDLDNEWTDFGMTGAWGSLVDGDVSDGDFEYTASYGTLGEAICTETGCIFTD